MASEHTVADNIVYDLISIQYQLSKARRFTTATSTMPTPPSMKTSRSSSVNASKRTNVVHFEPTSCSEL